MSYNPNILNEALQARRLNPAELSKRLKIDPGELNRELQRDPEPKQELLKKLAKELSVPVFAFYMRHLPKLEESIPDFRSLQPGVSVKSRETIEAIRLGEGIQRLVVELKVPGATGLPKFTATTDDEIEAFALKAREYFGITLDDQRNSKDARAFYPIVRSKIEDKGIIVLQDSFPREDGSGFCLAHKTHPLIVINTNQQVLARRCFTLAHELAHVLIGETGISDPFVRKNAIERRCNRFAGSFLAPRSYVSILLPSVTRDPDRDDVRWAAGKLKISQEATVLRLEQINLFKTGSHSKWLALVHNDNPDFLKKGGGGNGPPPQEKVKLAKYGFRFAKVFDHLLETGRISEINLYRASGLKPKYQRSYFSYVNSLTPDELQSLELDDG